MPGFVVVTVDLTLDGASDFVPWPFWEEVNPVADDVANEDLDSMFLSLVLLVNEVVDEFWHFGHFWRAGELSSPDSESARKISIKHGHKTNIRKNIFFLTSRMRCADMPQALSPPLFLFSRHFKFSTKNDHT